MEKFKSIDRNKLSNSNSFYCETYDIIFFYSCKFVHRNSSSKMQRKTMACKLDFIIGEKWRHVGRRRSHKHMTDTQI